MRSLPEVSTHDVPPWLAQFLRVLRAEWQRRATGVGSAPDKFLTLADLESMTFGDGAELTKEAVESVLKGEISSHTHSDVWVPNPYFIHLGKTAVQNFGGANGSTTTVEWEAQHNVGTGFTHSASVTPSRITFEFDGRVSVMGVVGAQQTGTARTTLKSAFAVNGGTLNERASTRNYSRGANYGDIGVVWMFELNVTSGDYLELITKVDDTDAAYTINSIVAECDLVIRRI